MSDDATLDHDGDATVELVRAYVQGDLSDLAARRVDQRATEEPELGALIAAYSTAHAATAGLVDEPPACAVTFADLERRIALEASPSAGAGGGVLGWRVWRAAAAVLLAAAAAYGGWSLSRPAEVRTVTLRAIPADAVAVAASPLDDVAAALAAYDPVVDGQPNWLGDYEQGRAMAAATGRPVLLFIHHPTCPLCIDLRAKTFRDEGVLAALDDFVPVEMDVTTAPQELAPLLTAGWPYLGAMDGDGQEIVAFAGAQTATLLRDRLADALTRAPEFEQRGWAVTRALATRLQRANTARDRGDMNTAFEEYAALVADDASGPFALAAGIGLDRIAQSAHQRLDGLTRHAAAAAEDRESIEAQVNAAADAFAKTPYAVDFEALREAVRDTGRFPRLVTSSSGGQ